MILKGRWMLPTGMISVAGMVLGALALHAAVWISSMGLVFAGGDVLVLRMTLSVILASSGLWSLISTHLMSPAASELSPSKVTAHFVFSLGVLCSISAAQAVLASSRDFSPARVAPLRFSAEGEAIEMLSKSIWISVSVELMQPHCKCDLEEGKDLPTPPISLNPSSSPPRYP